MRTRAPSVARKRLLSSRVDAPLLPAVHRGLGVARDERFRRLTLPTRAIASATNGCFAGATANDRIAMYAMTYCGRSLRCLDRDGRWRYSTGPRGGRDSRVMKTESLS